MDDIRDRWEEILTEATADGSIDQYLDDVLEGLGRNQMARAGTGGDPLRGRHSNAYDDIPDEEKTLGECDDDPIAEALAATGLAEDDAAATKRRTSSINAIRTSLEMVWQMLGKAETKLGAAKFKADEVDFTSIEDTIGVLIRNVEEVMDRIEATREKVSL